jgi:hypothetical protein
MNNVQTPDIETMNAAPVAHDRLYGGVKLIWPLNNMYSYRVMFFFHFHLLVHFAVLNGPYFTDSTPSPAMPATHLLPPVFVQHKILVFLDSLHDQI